LKDKRAGGLALPCNDAPRESFEVGRPTNESIFLLKMAGSLMAHMEMGGMDET